MLISVKNPSQPGYITINLYVFVDWNQRPRPFGPFKSQVTALAETTSGATTETPARAGRSDAGTVLDIDILFQ